MIRKNQRPLNFTDSQVQQLRQNTCGLRKLNRAALVALRRVGCESLTDKERRAAGDSFATIAAQMTFAFRVRRELLTAAAEQVPERINVILQEMCDPCPLNELSKKSDDLVADALEDPAHQAEIESLITLAMRVEARVSVRFESGRAPRAFLHGINRLTLAVLRQQRELGENAIKRQPEIRILERCENCAYRDQPMQTEDDQGELTIS